MRAARIQEALAERGWTQRELGTRIGVNSVSAWKIAQGLTVPRKGTLRRMCQELGVKPAWVMYGSPPKYLEPGERVVDLGVSLPGPNRAPGLVEWLEGTKEGRACTDAEREWLAEIPWPEEPIRAPDEAYLSALMAFRSLKKAVG